jgi:hypothetical protein
MHISATPHTRRGALLGALVVSSALGCSSRSDTCGAIGYPEDMAVFELPCNASDLLSVSLSGACATADASPSNYLSGQSVYVGSPNPGICHVALAFTTGFTYSTTVDFITQTTTGGCGPSEQFVGPIPFLFMIDAGATCSETGADANGSINDK